MKTRHALLLLGIVGLVLGFALWRGESERDVRAVGNAPADRVLTGEREVAELAAPATRTPDEPALREAWLLSHEEDAPALRATLGEGEAALDVEVVSRETGTPLAGVRLELTYEDESVERVRVATDDDGRATLRAPAEQVCQLNSWRRAGVESSRREVTTPAPGERLALRIELRTLADQVYFGRVVEVGTGAPLVGATARYEDEPNVRATTDADGLFELKSRSWEPATVRVGHEGHAWSLIETRPEHSTPEKAAVIRLARSARLVVHVERRDGPVAGLEVIVHTEGIWMRQRNAGQSWSHVVEPLWTALADASGTTVVEGLPPDVPLTVDVHDSGARIKRVPAPNLEPGEERELLIGIGFGCRIQGRAQASDGTPTEGLEVWLLPSQGAFRGRGEQYFRPSESENLTARTRVDAAGRFAFDDVAPGSWLVGLAAQNDPQPEAPVPVVQGVEITADDRVVEVTLGIQRGLTIQGRVVQSDGKSVSRALVAARSGRKYANAPGGVFTLGPLAPGEYELTASSKGFAPSEPVKARAGDRDVVLRVQRGGSIRVVTRGPAGEKVSAAANLFPDDVEVAGFVARNTSGNEDGSHTFDGLLPGLYHVVASDSFGNFGALRNLTVVAGAEAEERVLALSAGATVRVRIEGEAEGLFFRIVQEAVSVGFGPLDTPIAVGPGPVTVQLQSFDIEAKQAVVLETREAKVSAGEEVLVVFDRTER